MRPVVRAHPESDLDAGGTAHPPRTADDGDQQWLVGFRFRTPTGWLVRHYYLITQAEDETHAIRLAGQRARSAPERKAHDYAALDERWAEIRRIRRDALGYWHLSAL
ncbi:hypothetical protein [Streptantibioticus ferralitis]|uniref:Uncharacterized protein n=1 Tax=Streptantibioticus ferralitis TaxID=236510 RepID=A0ABT5Z1M7_9ACTN|nr:hypothetical protein [Streptantibioticus ferralitis]MDF2257552.1 hypothetical protein [Streptantibioticus ferralitis]